MSDKREYWVGESIYELPSNGIFVFGSNTEGRHGLGAALIARNKFGAKYGQARGLMGSCYGLVTKNLTEGFTETTTGITYTTKGGKSVTPKQIRSNILKLYQCCLDNPDKLFYIPYKLTTTSSNLNGYTPMQMFVLFTVDCLIPTNVVFHESYKSNLDV